MAQHFQRFSLAYWSLFNLVKHLCDNCVAIISTVRHIMLDAETAAQYKGGLSCIKGRSHGKRIHTITT